MGLLRELANSPLPVPQACDDAHFVKCISLMNILPRRQEDELQGRQRLALYKRHLGGFSDEAISHLTEMVTRTCHWFPTPAECLKILASWPNAERDAQRRDKAKVLVRREMQHRMEDAMERLRKREVDPAEIEAMPDLWKRAAAERMYLWAWPDGRFTVRADLDRLSEDERDAERVRVRAMMVEWEAIRAARAGTTEDEA